MDSSTESNCSPYSFSNTGILEAVGIHAHCRIYCSTTFARSIIPTNNQIKTPNSFTKSSITCVLSFQIPACCLSTPVCSVFNHHSTTFLEFSYSPQIPQQILHISKECLADEVLLLHLQCHCRWITLLFHLDTCLSGLIKNMTMYQSDAYFMAANRSGWFNSNRFVWLCG